MSNQTAAASLQAELAPLQEQLKELYSTAPPPVWQLVNAPPFIMLVSSGLGPAERAMERLIKARMQKIRNSRGYA